jgi:4-hydroxyacetophenone monooxygenase
MAELDGREDLIEKTLPDYPVFGKRMIIDNGWFQALRRENVRLITSPIMALAAKGVVTAAGFDEVDVVIYATGFHADQVMGGITITGRDGADVRVRLDESPEAYLGMALEDCPNFFVIPGPNGIPGHGGSAVFYAECQVGYIVNVLRFALENDHRRFEVTPRAVRLFVDETVELLDQLVWGNCDVSNWFRGGRDRVTTISPRRILDLWDYTRSVEPSVFAWD